MATSRKHVEDILYELARIQRMPASHIGKDDDSLVPRMIAAGDGGSIIVSLKIDQSIAAVADQLIDTDATLPLICTRAEWRSSVRRAFGPALAQIDPNDDSTKNADVVLADIRATLSKQVSGHGVQEFGFGCTLFRNAAVQLFAIGPVRFEPRLDWLARKHEEGVVTDATRRRIEQIWLGKRLRKRKPSRDSIGEADILDTVDSCRFVCSVATDGLAAEAGREKALLAARLATAAIALLWQTPSRALAGLNLLYDRSPHRQKALTFIPGNVVLAGSSWSHMKGGPWLKTCEWEKTFALASDHFAVVGDVLDYVVSPTGKVTRPNIMNTLAHALLWFHEGCRELVAVLAIVKFSAALDSLACGTTRKGILRVANARLGIQDTMTIWPEGPTLKQAIDKVYDEGRNRTIHGRNDKLGHDWTNTRDLAEQLARFCLLSCIEWTAKNPSSDDPSQLSR